MTGFELRWSDNSINEYVRGTMFGKGIRKVSVISCVITFVILAALCIIVYFVNKQVPMLVLGITALLLSVVFVAAMELSARSVCKKLSKAYKITAGLICALSENDIIVIKDGSPVNLIKWDTVNEINESASAFFIKTKDDLLLILEKDAVISGELSAAEQLISEKKKALPDDE